MKKGLLFGLAVAFGVSGFAQTRTVIPTNLLERSVTKTEDFRTDNFITGVAATQNPTVSSNRATEGTIVGKTGYDLQSNAVLGERAYMTPEGKAAIVWTQGNDGAQFADRGTGYNFFDGIGWQGIPEERIEASTRTGWPSIAMFGDGEAIVNHGGDLLNLLTRDERGTGAWTETTIPSAITGLTWPRLATSGDNNEIMHVIANTYEEYNGQPRAMVYSRSTDGGTTWEEFKVLEGMGSEYYAQINADDYKIVTRGNTVVIGVTSPWYDLFYMKSDDNGETWTKNIVWENPYSKIAYADINMGGDSLYTACGDLALDIDEDLQVHLAFGITRNYKNEVGPDSKYSNFPWVDGLAYWNESMEPFTADDQHKALEPASLEENVNLIGWIPDIDGDGQITTTDTQLPQTYPTPGLSSMPTLKVIDKDHIVVLYTSLSEKAQPYEDGPDGPLNLRHVFGRSYNAEQDEPWSNISHLTETFLYDYEEIVYPYIIGVDGTTLHWFYSADDQPGLYLRDEEEGHGQTINRIMAATNPLSDLFSTVGVENVSVAKTIEVSQNYPNPSNGTTMIDVTVKANATANVSVVNMVGQVVYNQVENVYAGTNNIAIEARDLAEGIYFYTVTVGSAKVTKKMIVR